MHKLISLVLAGVLFAGGVASAQASDGASGSLLALSPYMPLAPGSEDPEEATTTRNTEDDRADAEVDGSADASVSNESDTSSDDDRSDAGVSFSLTQKEAASISIDAESAELGSASVSSGEDLSLYATSKMKRDANIESVDVSGDRVSVEYRRKARFLGFIPASIRANAEITSDGEVDIDYPWYRFLFAVDGTADAEAQLKASVQELMAGSGAGAGFTARLEAEIIDAIHAAFSGSLAASADAY